MNPSPPEPAFEDIVKNLCSLLVYDEVEKQGQDKRVGVFLDKIADELLGSLVSPDVLDKLKQDQLVKSAINSLLRDYLLAYDPGLVTHMIIKTQRDLFQKKVIETAKTLQDRYRHIISDQDNEAPIRVYPMQISRDRLKRVHDGASNNPPARLPESETPEGAGLRNQTELISLDFQKLQQDNSALRGALDRYYQVKQMNINETINVELAYDYSKPWKYIDIPIASARKADGSNVDVNLFSENVTLYQRFKSLSQV